MTKRNNSILFLLATLLRWEGVVRPTRLGALLGMHRTHASRQIRKLRETSPRLLQYDHTEKGWIAGRWAKFPENADLHAYLRILSDYENPPPPWLSDARLTFQDPEPRLFAVLRRACVESKGVDIHYASMTHPEGTRRRIYPHSLVQLGRRWHTRAWCETREEYRDFNLGRMWKPKLAPPRQETLPHDTQWETRVSLEFGAHRALSAPQALLIRHEYFGGTMGRRVVVRGALVPYTLQDLRIAVDPDREKPPDYQLELLNLDDVQRYLFY